RLPSACRLSPWRRPRAGSTSAEESLVTRSAYNDECAKSAANFQPLTPVVFLQRAAGTFPDRVAIIHGGQRRSYAEFYARCRRLASALAGRGIGVGDTVSVM